MFKENLKLVYKPVKHRHFKYGTKTGNRFLAHLRVGRSFLNSYRFVTGLSDTDKCKNPAYGRHWIFRPMRIIGPIIFCGAKMVKKIKNQIKKKYIYIHVTRDMWNVICDMWHVTRDMCHLSHFTSHLSLQEQPQPQTLPFVTCPVGAQ